MIFSSIPFLFAFLPVTLLWFHLAARFGRTPANLVLLLASLAFYSYWNWRYLFILIGSMCWNYGIGHLVFQAQDQRGRKGLILLSLGIAGDLLALFYFKYFAAVLGFGAEHGLWSRGSVAIALPLGISFFTFTQIGYLVDSYDGRAKDRGALPYGVFVTFFPHLIAGPILHNREILPQITGNRNKGLKIEDLSVGLAMFAMGMAKKVLLADPLGFVVDRGFADAHGLSAGSAWVTVLAYSLQLYFDFSGYSDMAIGLARMFGIIFPANFNSPYKASSIIDFWSRWHMTLTRYITLYLYNPVAMRVNRWRVARGLSTSKKGTRNLPAFSTMIVFPMFYTMALAGIWHGAGLQFLIFGLLHAAYLCINHAWRIFGPETQETPVWRTSLFIVFTYAGVLLAQIFFRAASVDEAVVVLSAMSGSANEHVTVALPGSTTVFRIVLGFIICLCLPNSQQILRNFRPVLDKITIPRFEWPVWTPNIKWGLGIGVVLLVSLLRMSDVSKFLYFQF